MRDKLIALINENRACPEEDGYPCEKCVYDTSPSCFVDRLADVLIANGVTFADVTDTNVGKWIPVDEAKPELIPNTAGTAYSDAVNCLTSGRKVITAIWDGTDFIGDDEFWEAEDETITHWTPVLLPMPEPPKEGE